MYASSALDEFSHHRARGPARSGKSPPPGAGIPAPWARKSGPAPGGGKSRPKVLYMVGNAQGPKPYKFTWCGDIHSAELQGPRKPLRIRPDMFDFEPDLGLKLSQTKPQHIRHGTHKPAHNDSERFWPDFGVVPQWSDAFHQ